MRKAVPVKPPAKPLASAGRAHRAVLLALYLGQAARTAANPELPQLAADWRIGRRPCSPHLRRESLLISSPFDPANS